MPSIRDEIRFWLNDQLVTLSAFNPQETLLDFLRLNRRLTGSKEGCAEGDCGACTALVGRLYRGELVYETINSCIRFLPSLDGCHVVTIEALKGKEGKLHPVQQSMIDHHGSQCGFCTPGIVMSLYALWMETPKPDRQQVETALQGNLCRCTGYSPILKAAEAISDYGNPAADWLEAQRNANFDRLAALKHGDRVVIEKDGQRAILPANLDDLSHVRLDEPEATIIAGSTDVGLWVTKNMRPLGAMLFVGHLEEMKNISCAKPYLTLGAAVTYSEAQGEIAKQFEHLEGFWSRIAGQQIRNMGTIGGNVANGSPIGDLPPVFIALGADIILRKGWEERRIPMEEFFIAYGKQDRRQGDFVKAIRIPIKQPNSYHAAYKISKRRDEDISSVCVAFNLTVEKGLITKARIAFGGMAATPKRAAHCEASLVGQPFEEASFVVASSCLSDDFTPLSDWRASDVYRMKVAKNLFRRFWLDKMDGQRQTEAAE